MPAYFVVENQMGSSSPNLYISQLPLEDILQNLKRFYTRSARFQVYELRVINKNQEYNPQGCNSLALVGVVEPFDVVEHYKLLLGIELDKLPTEQSMGLIQECIDHLEKKKIRAENKGIIDDQPEVAQ